MMTNLLGLIQHRDELRSYLSYCDATGIEPDPADIAALEEAEEDVRQYAKLVRTRAIRIAHNQEN